MKKEYETLEIEIKAFVTPDVMAPSDIIDDGFGEDDDQLPS